MVVKNYDISVFKIFSPAFFEKELVLIKSVKLQSVYIKTLFSNLFSI